MPTIRSHFLLPLIIAAACFGSSRAADLDALSESDRIDQIKWAWNCKSDGFYIIHVLPNGQFYTASDANTAPVTITVKEAGPHTSQSCVGDNSPFYNRYYAELKGDGVVEGYNYTHPSGPYGGHTSHCAQFNISHTGDSLDSISFSAAGNSPVSLKIEKDDQDWRFSINGLSLNTEKSSREIRILVPKSVIKVPAEATTWIETGQCIMTTGKPTVP